MTVHLLQPIRRHLPELAAILLTASVYAGVVAHRKTTFAGHGLKATYYPTTDWTGRPFLTRVETSIDASDSRTPLYKRPKFSVEWTGTIVLPCDGRYGFVTDSDDGSSLSIDDRMVVNNLGAHDDRQATGADMFQAGKHKITIRYFQAGGGARMRAMWIPCNRRGDPEYISPTLLYPDPPERARTANAHSVPPNDFQLTALLYATLLLVLLTCCRRGLRALWLELHRSPTARADLLFVALIFGAALLLRLWDLSAAGQTWDEDVYFSSGRNFVQNLLAADFHSSAWAWNLEHPATAKWLYGPFTLLGEDMAPVRAAAAVMGALTCAVVYLIGRQFTSRFAVGLIGALLCVAMPHVVAHSKIIGLEGPSALLYALAILTFLRGLTQGGNSRWFLLTALCAGLLVGTRIVNVSVFFVFGTLYLYRHYRTIRAEGELPMPVTLGLMPLFAVVVFFLSWPYLWSNPMQHIGTMLSHWTKDPFDEVFLGTRQPAPLYYFPLYFLVTMPAALLPLWLIGLGQCLVDSVRNKLPSVALLAWFVAPFVVMLSPLARDGVRYLYPALIPACLLAAVGIDTLGRGISRLARRKAILAPTLATLGAAAGVYTLQAGLAVHPYYLDYYNEAVGGTERVAQKQLFEIAWWGEGIHEAAEYIGRVAPKAATVFMWAEPKHVLRLRSDLVRVPTTNADFIIFNLLFAEKPTLNTHRIVYVVRANGAPLVWVYQRNPDKPQGR